MYSQINHGKVVTVSNKLNNNIHDNQSAHRICGPAKENVSSHAIFSTKRSNECNKKKVTGIRNKLKNNLNNNNNINSGEANNFNNKPLILSKKDITSNNSTVKSNKNYNINLNRYQPKSFNNNVKSNNTTNILTPNVQSPYPPSINITPITVSNNTNREMSNNNFYYNSFNQGPPPMGNAILYQSHMPNQTILTYNNQCCQQVNFDNWNRNSTKFFQQEHINHELDNNNNGKQFLVNHITSIHVPLMDSNIKQNTIKNNYIAHNKTCGGYISNPELHSTSAISSSHQNSRVKNHQNYHNLKYVVTNKENGTNLPNKNKIEPPDKSEIVLNKITENKVNDLNIDLKNSNTVIENVESLYKEDTTLSKSSLTGYESDSSYSSGARNSLEPIIQNEQYPTTQVLPNYSVPSTDSDFYRSNNYAWLQQNFTYFNAKPNCSTITMFSPQKLYHQTEQATIFLNNNPTILQSPKRISRRQHFHGKKNWFSTLKSFHIPENTPPDRFLIKSHLMEIKESPKNLTNGSEWDQLSTEIWNRLVIYQQKENTYRKKIFLWKYLYLVIKTNFPRYGLYLVGSTITGFGTNCSDVDMCLVHRASFSLDSRFEAISHLNGIKEYLKTFEVFEKFHLIEAKVPILRFCDPNTSLEVDLNFNNSVGIRNTHLLYCYAQLDWRLKPLVLITKLWARYHNINNAKTMTISSYSLVLMVIHFLQFSVSPPVLPCLHQLYPEKFNIILTSNDFGFVDMIEDIGPYESKNTNSLGELFLLFLEYYSNFNYSKYAISVRTGKVLPIEECRNAQALKNDIHQWKQLCIEEPFDLTNTARSVYDCETFDKIKNIFLMSWKILESTLDLNTIFAPLCYVQKSSI